MTTGPDPSVTEEEVRRFLAETRFSGYQWMPLPFGLEVPGRSAQVRADRILGDRVRGRSVLDVGTYYGYFPYEAMQRGARAATGLETDAERHAIARRIAELHGGTYEVVHGQVEDLGAEESFDVILLLNVLHHVMDPIPLMRKLASICQHALIIEFCLADDPAYMSHLYSQSLEVTTLQRIRARAQSWLLRLAAGRLPLMAVGNLPYYYSFYFSREAFYNLFVIHHKLFSDIEFLPSDTGRRRALAVCTPVTGSAPPR